MGFCCREVMEQPPLPSEQWVPFKAALPMLHLFCSWWQLVSDFPVFIPTHKLFHPVFFPWSVVHRSERMAGWAPSSQTRSTHSSEFVKHLKPAANVSEPDLKLIRFHSQLLQEQSGLKNIYLETNSACQDTYWNTQITLNFFFPKCFYAVCFRFVQIFVFKHYTKHLFKQNWSCSAFSDFLPIKRKIANLAPWACWLIMFNSRYTAPTLHRGMVWHLEVAPSNLSCSNANHPATLGLHNFPH